MFNMRRFDDLAENLKARHALSVVDSCFSGTVGAFSTMDYTKKIELDMNLGFEKSSFASSPISVI